MNDDTAASVEAALEAAIERYQADVVIPHCTSCTRPCCNLEDVVLELDWPRAQELYQITSSRRRFDMSLKDGSGPPHIKEQRGRYYAHTKPCPAFDGVTHLCAVYGTDTKPPECTEFPLYRDGDAITADLRCEAVNLDDLHRHLERAAGISLERTVDPDFPSIVTFTW